MVAQPSLHYESGLDFQKCRGKCELIGDLKFTTPKNSNVNRGANCGACGPYGERERNVQSAGGETRGEETAG